MKYSIVYSSRTGNTRMLAEAVRAALPEADCVYYGEPDSAALDAERIYCGFWTDRGSCDAASAEFLKTLDRQELFLFGTAGFGGSEEYFDRVLSAAGKNVPEGVRPAGSFMCQGRMPDSVRQRYEKMSEGPNPPANVGELIANFDRALQHPNEKDIENLRTALKKAD